MKARIITLFVLLATIISAGAQDLLEMVKRDIDAERRTIVAEAMDIPQEVEIEFWRVYNEMQQKMGIITDKRAANIKKFADSYENVTDDVANDLANTYIEINIERFKIYKTYYKKMSKLISKKESARFIQLLGQIQLLIDIQIAAEVPLIE